MGRDYVPPLRILQHLWLEMNFLVRKKSSKWVLKFSVSFSWNSTWLWCWCFELWFVPKVLGGEAGPPAYHIWIPPVMYISKKCDILHFLFILDENHKLLSFCTDLRKNRKFFCWKPFQYLAFSETHVVVKERIMSTVSAASAVQTMFSNRSQASSLLSWLLSPLPLFTMATISLQLTYHVSFMLPLWVWTHIFQCTQP